MKKIINSIDCRCEIVADGEQLLNAYIEDHEGIDVILTDFDMPVLDGISASAKIRDFERARGLPKKPIAVITGNSSEHTRKLATQAGCNEFLVKPLGRADLAVTLMRLMSTTFKILVIDDDEL